MLNAEVISIQHSPAVALEEDRHDGEVEQARSGSRT
jgi:hypothetical protein